MLIIIFNNDKDHLLGPKQNMRLVLRRVLWILLFNGEVVVLFGDMDCGTIGLLGDMCVSNST